MNTRSLTARRKADTEQEIAQAAAALFAERSVTQVTAEQIAERVGMSVRTFYRYFPRKEDAIAPLLTVGAERWQDALTQLSSDELYAGIPQVIRAMLTNDAGELDAVRSVLRGAISDSGLRAVWHRVNDDSEQCLHATLSARGDIDVLDARLLANVATDSIRIALEHWAEADDSVAPAVLATEIFARMSQGLRG